MHTYSVNMSLLAGALFLTVASSECSAQCALFDQSTDTIAFAGNTILGTTATYEAVVALNASSFGSIFFEQVNGLEHKNLTLSGTAVSGYGFTFPIPSYFFANAPVSLGVFHHVAFVRDGDAERIYLDGTLLATRDITGDIADHTQQGHPGAIGASQFDSTNAPLACIMGLLDSVRVSNIARYSGASFSAPTGDLPADANTLLLYNFNPAEVSGNTITDLSGNGHTGTFASGFVGATAPSIVPRPCAPDLNQDGVVNGADLGILLGNWGNC